METCILSISLIVPCTDVTSNSSSKSPSSHQAFQSVGKRKHNSSLRDCLLLRLHVQSCRMTSCHQKVFLLCLGVAEPGGLFIISLLLVLLAGPTQCRKKDGDRAPHSGRHTSCEAELVLINKPLGGASLDLFFFYQCPRLTNLLSYPAVDVCSNYSELSFSLCP